MIIPTAVVVIGVIGAAAAKKVCVSGLAPASAAEADEHSDAEAVALYRMRKICRGPVAAVGEVHVSVLDARADPTGGGGGDGEWLLQSDAKARIGAWPDRHLSHTDKKLVMRRLTSALGVDAARIALCPSKRDHWAHDPYVVDDAAAAVAREVRKACVAPVVTDREDGGVIGAQITEDGVFVPFQRGVRLSLQQKDVILARYMAKLPRKQPKPRPNVTLIDDLYREEHGMTEIGVTDITFTATTTTTTTTTTSESLQFHLRRPPYDAEEPPLET